MADSLRGARFARRIPALAIVTIVTLAAGCSGEGPVPSVPPTSTAQAAEPASRPAANVDCDALHAAHTGLSLQLQTMLFLNSDEAYANQQGPDILGLTKLDVARFRRDLELLATLPEPGGDNPFFKPLSTVIPQFRELADLLEVNLRSGRPFGDGSGNGEKLQKLAERLSIDGRVAISRAYEAAGCRPR